jgi:hypothetical protein
LSGFTDKVDWNEQQKIAITRISSDVWSLIDTQCFSEYQNELMVSFEECPTLQLSQLYDAKFRRLPPYIIHGPAG